MPPPLPACSAGAPAIDGIGRVARFTAWAGRLARLPSPCAVCRSWAGARVCGACTARFANPVPRCRLCAIEVPAAASVCADCLLATPPFSAAVAAVAYAFPWDRLVARLKFHDGLDVLGSMADLLHAAVGRSAAAGHTAAADLVVPVPLAAARLRERGFNQAWELARRVAAPAGLPARADLLQRWADGAHQAALDRSSRARAIQGAFGVPAAARPHLHGRAVALVDDVLTTGATAAEAARALLDGGAASVQVWAFARTPRPEDD